MALLETQAAHPDATILAYLDDTYYLQMPAAALACMRSGTAATLAICEVDSNLAKQEAYSPEGDLSCLPSTLRGAPAAPSDPAAG